MSDSLPESSYSAGIDSAAPIDEFYQIVKNIDDLVYDDLFVADHAMKKNTYALQALASHYTSRIRIGTGVTNPYSRNPGLTAASIATINEISEGRAVLGIGAGGHGVGPFGYDQSRPIGAIRETVDTVRRIASGETVSKSNPDFELDAAHLEFPAMDEEIPVYIAGRGPQLLQLAGKIADGAIAGAGLASVPAMDYAREQVTAGAESVGRDPDEIDLRCWTFVSLANDAYTAKTGVSTFVARLVKSHAPEEVLRSFGIDQSDIDDVKQLGDIDDYSPTELLDYLSDDVLELFAIVGDHDDCRRHVEELHRSGVDHISVLPFENEENTRWDILESFSSRIV